MSRHFYLLLILLMTAVSCTAPRWVISGEEAVDTEAGEVIASVPFLQAEERVTPEDPTLRWQLHLKTTREYPVRVRAERHLQEYRLRPEYVLLGAAGAGVAFWLANNGEGNRIRQVGLNAAGGLIALYGLLNMKPSGPPQPTGEVRFLRQTGTVQRTDTSAVSSPGEDLAEVTLLYNGDLVWSDSVSLSPEGMLEINLGTPVSNLQPSGPEPGEVQAEVVYADSLYRSRFAVERVLQPYAETTAPVTELRREPEEGDNVLAELAEGSRLTAADPAGAGEWYRVRYGISDSYIRKSSARLVWDTAESEEANRVVTLTQVPFGQVDVETNIPILSPPRPSSRALVVTNERYEEPYGNRTYTHRDGQLITRYLVRSLGYPAEGVDTLRDAASAGTLLSRLERLEREATDSSRVFIYLGGYAAVKSDSSGIGLYYRLSADTAAADTLSLYRLFDRIGAIPGGKVVVADLDFVSEGESPDERTVDLRQPLRTLSERITGAGSQAAVFFPSEINQRSRLYIGPSVDKKHHIFTYWFVRALQERHTTVSAIRQYLDNNVTYTARRYHDRPQDPHLFGNTGINLAGER